MRETEARLVSVLDSAVWVVALPGLALALAPAGGRGARPFFYRSDKSKTRVDPPIEALGDALSTLEDSYTVLVSALTSDADSKAINTQVSKDSFQVVEGRYSQYRGKCSGDRSLKTSANMMDLADSA